MNTIRAPTIDFSDLASLNGGHSTVTLCIFTKTRSTHHFVVLHGARGMMSYTDGERSSVRYLPHNRRRVPPSKLTCKIIIPKRLDLRERFFVRDYIPLVELFGIWCQIRDDHMNLRLAHG